MTDKPKSRATIGAMDALHGLLAEALATELRRCADAKECPSPAFLGQVVKFLAQNGIDQPARAAAIDRLLGLLPSTEELDAMERGAPVPLLRPVAAN